jgi:polyhydroxyalkanoate synthase
MSTQTQGSRSEAARTESQEEKSDLRQLLENFRTIQRVTTTRYPHSQSPYEVVWTLNKSRLLRYLPTEPVEQKKRTPLILVFALMSRAYIIDLRPDSSFVRYMANKGYDLYLLDWGSPGHEDRNLKFDDFILDYLPRAIRKMKRVSGSNDFSMLGWCIGAILSTCYAALRPDDGIKNLVLLTAPLDFTDIDNTGGFGKWVKDDYINPERIVTAFGNMPADMLNAGAKMLKPVENYVGTYMHLLSRLDNPNYVDSWHAMNTWVEDPIPMPGAVFRQLVNDIFRGNKLVQGTLQLKGETVHLENVRANLLNIIADADHITPPCESENLLPRFGSEDKQFITLKAGHIGVMLSGNAPKVTWPLIEGWLAERD